MIIHITIGLIMILIGLGMIGHVTSELRDNKYFEAEDE